MQQYHKLRICRKRRVPNQIPSDYWQAFNRLYGLDQSGKTSRSSISAKINELNADKSQKALP